MDERELNRAIDAAAEQMMAREPSRSLGYNVMARVRGAADTSAPRRFMWMTAAASAVVLAGVVALVTMNQAPAPPVAKLPPASQQSRLVTPPPPLVVQDVVGKERIRTARPPVVRVSTPSRVRTLPTFQGVPPLEPLEAEPIALSSIDVSPIPNQTTSLDRIEIEVLIIEPLTASND